MKRFLSQILLGSLLSGALGLSAQAEVTAFRNFTLIDAGKNTTVAGQAMIVDNGEITWVGPNAKAKVPAGAKTVDLRGKFVVPGLIDLHVHLGTVRDLTQTPTLYNLESVKTDLRQYAAYGVTTVQSMGTDTDAIFEITKERSGRPTYSRVYAAGQGLVYCTPLATCTTGFSGIPLKGGYGGIIPGINAPFDAREAAIREVNAQADKGADFIKLWVDDEFGTFPKMPAEIRTAIIEESHKRGLRTLAHVFYLEDARQLVEAGVDGFVHMVRDKPVDAALIAEMKARGTWQVSGTLSREASMFAFGGKPPFLDDPFFTQSLSPTALALLRSEARQKSIAGGPRFQDYKNILANAEVSFKRYVDAGIPYGFGTDSGPPGRYAGYFAHWELEELVNSGLTPAQALTSATSKSAQWLRNAKIGAIEPGRWADILVLDANPLIDIRNTHKIAAVYIAGNAVPSVKR